MPILRAAILSVVSRDPLSISDTLGWIQASYGVGSLISLCFSYSITSSSQSSRPPGVSPEGSSWLTGSIFWATFLYAVQTRAGLYAWVRLSRATCSCFVLYLSARSVCGGVYFMRAVRLLLTRVRSGGAASWLGFTLVGSRIRAKNAR